MMEMLPSGRQPILNNRVHWAKTYLAQAKLLEITRRAHFRITDRGREVLRENVDVRLLERFPEFNEFKQRARNSQTGDLFPSFTRPAQEFAERHPFKVVLIDGTQLAALMIRHDVGVRTAETLHVKKLDEKLFIEE
jgi:restriction endonuclease Mrr